MLESTVKKEVLKFEYELSQLRDQLRDQGKHALESQRSMQLRLEASLQDYTKKEVGGEIRRLKSEVAQD